MNELGAKLNRSRGMGIRDGEDAAAYAVPCFENFDINASLVQGTRSGESGCAGTDHYDHERNVLQSTMDN
jgi:hypothetical protein